VLNSTNGSRIIEVAQGIFAILAGAFVNAHAVADKLEICAYGERVAVTGCGWEGRRASEDESDVGASLYRMRQRGVGLDERARWVVDLYLAPEKILRRTSVARRLARLGHERDIDFCLAVNTVPVVPRLEGGYLRPAMEGCWPEGLTEGARNAPNICQEYS
jgi:2-phosphosulfolactate phosphatase